MIVCSDGVVAALINSDAGVSANPGHGVSISMYAVSSVVRYRVGCDTQ